MISESKQGTITEENYNVLDVRIRDIFLGLRYMTMLTSTFLDFETFLAETLLRS